VITVGIDPTIELGPATVSWHGLTIAIGVFVGLLLAARVARERELSPAPIHSIGLIVALGGLVGGKALFLVETGGLANPEAWVSAQGFTFNGGLLLAAVGIAVYLWRTATDLIYLDVVAVAFPLGVAVGRIGDVINGEHFGPPSDWPLAVRNTHPDASVPSTDVAYHSGGLYEVILAALIFAVVWPLRHRLRRPLLTVWVVIGLFALGRFVAFFFRSDSQELALGLNGAQWSSVVLLAASAVGAWHSAQGRPALAAGTRH
jgi:phosphatidylglycerol:prolipoprotein diacylglycerol transferase